MHRVPAGLAGLALATGVAATVALPASAAPPEGSKGATVRQVSDDLTGRAEEKRRALRKAGLQKVLNGTAKVEQRGASKVVRVGETATPGARSKAAAEDQYVELSREKTDKIFVILAEFGNTRHPDYPDQDTSPATPGPTRFDGPLHNQIPEPDRSKDNRTIWQADYSRAHYQQLYFGSGEDSLKSYYERQSSGRYSVDGQVTDWVKVKYNEARYGRSDGYPCALNVCSNTEDLIRDAVNKWVKLQKKAGRTDAQIAADLKSYDAWDRNDFDADGDFNEPDGYIDHFQIVHAGGDQADGDPYQGEDAIWSHRSKAFRTADAGPANNKDGGTQIGETGLWVADFTIQPENGGVSVFAHEYAHDLGLPDEYDTAAGGDNPVNWWSLMAQSRASAPGDQGIGTRAADLGAWDKLQLGWLDYEIVPAGTTRTLALGPHEYNSAKAQGIVSVLPQKAVTTEFGAPAAGESQWWSDSGDDLETTLSREVTLPAGAATLTFQARWNIEDCGPDACDYAYVEVDDGTGWKAIPGSITKPAEGNAIDGVSDGWVPATFDLSAYAGKTIGLRFRYATDGAAQGTDPDALAGLFVDEITVTAGGTAVFTRGRRQRVDGRRLQDRRHVGDDDVRPVLHRLQPAVRLLRPLPAVRAVPLRVHRDPAPVRGALPVSGRADRVPVGHRVHDNNTSAHPGQGEILPVDAHPDPIYRLDGAPWRGRIQTYDAPFSLQKADSFTLHMEPTGRASYIRGQDAQPVFDDRRSYWNATQPRVGVKVPNAGVRMRVLSQDGTSMRVRVDSTK